MKEMSRKGTEDRTVLVAEKQSAGRGQHGRAFESPEGGLYCSIFRKTSLPIESPGEFTAAAGEAVRRAVKSVCGLDTDIKPPNDILYKGRKICGILTESYTQGGDEIGIVIGIGLNVNTELDELSAEISNTADSLKNICGREFDKNELLAEILKEVEKWFNSRKRS